ncbi:MAG: hypothetical protein FRX49_07808 [Trebouxia sp. A1-2]|nr:MAG: hypothetical protein FRX49_07808 [Trebouxia sp. A1-2]
MWVSHTSLVKFISNRIELTSMLSESGADVTRAMSSKFPKAHLCVDNVSNGVNKLHDVLLQHLSGVGEVADVTEPKDGDDLVAWNHGVQIAPTPYIVGYDLCPSIPKAHGQKAADLVDGILQDPGFHLGVVAVMLGGLRFRQGIL